MSYKQLPDDWSAQARFYPYAINFAANKLLLLEMDRSQLARSVFLDQRTAADPSQAIAAPIEKLAAVESKPLHRPPAFLFHTAFCCSTLLARSLDHPGRSLVLREPSTLLQLADLERGRYPHTDWRSRQLLAPILSLLTRPFIPGETTLIKPTNLANRIAADVLHLYPNAPALILHDGLEPFVISVLKRPRESASGMVQFIDRLKVDFQPAYEAPAPQGLPEMAALAWWLQAKSLQTRLGDMPCSRIRMLATPDLLANPARLLPAAARWLGIEMDSATVQSIVRGPLWTGHAKHPSLPYSPAQRQADQALVRRLLPKELSRARRFAEHLGWSGETLADLLSFEPLR